jgi:hypothetical protein
MIIIIYIYIYIYIIIFIIYYIILLLYDNIVIFLQEEKNQKNRNGYNVFVFKLFERIQRALTRPFGVTTKSITWIPVQSIM